MEDMTYIETGSLISIKENVNDILIPSEEESLTANCIFKCNIPLFVAFSLS